MSAKALRLLRAQEAAWPRPQQTPGPGTLSAQCYPVLYLGEGSLEQVPPEDRQWHAPSTASK